MEELSQGLSQESLDTLDFVPTEAELAHVNRMADDVVRTLDNKDKFYGRRNRSAQKRMNRPHKADAQSKGASIIYGLLERAVPKAEVI